MTIMKDVFYLWRVYIKRYIAMKDTSNTKNRRVAAECRKDIMQI